MRTHKLCRRRLPLGLVLGLAALGASPSMAADAAPDYFAAALCQPPYSLDSADRLSHAAEALGKPDMTMLGIARFHLPKPIERDGFVAQDVIFSSSAYGLLLDGEVAKEVARRYDLTRETFDLMGASSEGYARALPDSQQDKERGVVSIVARQSEVIPGKTLLMCELVSPADRAALEMMAREQP
ncbi:hypothetical protein ACR720_02185 [Sphingomonas parapaucimobilis]|uniref:hypothetical protein n=1 Tax=Sphingomonas parapaucimobilis TaxID=28213 RepID=UPI0039EBD1A0